MTQALKICIIVNSKTPGLLLVDTLLQMLMKYFAIVSVEIPRSFCGGNVACSKPKSVDFIVGEPACPYHLPALKVGMFHIRMKQKPHTRLE